MLDAHPATQLYTMKPHNQPTQEKNLKVCQRCVTCYITMTKQTQQSTKQAATTNPIFEKDHITSIYDKPLSLQIVSMKQSTNDIVIQ